MKDGVSLDRLIVLTFTRAAAGEMKERLRKNSCRKSRPGTDLREALDYLDQATVRPSTVSLSLVRRYHYRLGVDRSLTIGDGVLFS